MPANNKPKETNGERKDIAGCIAHDNFHFSVR